MSRGLFESPSHILSPNVSVNVLMLNVHSRKLRSCKDASDSFLESLETMNQCMSRSSPVQRTAKKCIKLRDPRSASVCSGTPKTLDAEKFRI